MLIENTWNWRTGGSRTMMMRILIQCDDCKNTSKTPMLNVTSSTVLARSHPLQFLTKHLHGCQFASSKKVINEVHTFFNSLPQVKFENTIEVKWAERMELCIANEGWYFKADYRLFDSWNTPQNAKHSLYTFRISGEFRILLMLRKNKPWNPFFCANVQPGTKCEKQKKSCEMRKKWRDIPRYTLFVFRVSQPFSHISRYAYSRPKKDFTQPVTWELL